MATCEELLAQYEAETKPDLKEALRQQLIAAECGDPLDPDGSGGHGPKEPPHG